LMDDEDGILGKEELLLTPATTLSLEEAYALVTQYNGVCYPAHIDRTSNGVIAMLGTFPEEPKFTAYELNGADSEEEYRDRFPIIRDLVHTVSSDAHYLWDIAEEGFVIAIDDEPYSSANVRNKLIDYLSGK
ncbi:MAG: hypothetical protein J6I42_00265, partial [Clostridia bacterium]|nr:hypothetical protein [Clostridia bacterium]